MPKPKGKPVRITTFVDSDHAYDIETRSYVTVVFLLLKKNLNTMVQQLAEYRENLNLCLVSGGHDNCHGIYHINALQAQNSRISY